MNMSENEAVGKVLYFNGLLCSHVLMHLFKYLMHKKSMHDLSVCVHGGSRREWFGANDMVVNILIWC